MVSEQSPALETVGVNMDSQQEKGNVLDSSTQSDESHSEETHTKESESLPGWKIFVIWLAIALGVLCTFLDEGIIATAIPRITDEFGSLTDVGWYGSAYQMTLCAFQLIFGRLYNQFNVKIIFVISLVIFEIGSLICAVSPSSAVFIVGRAVAGLGASGLQSGCLVLISAALPAKHLPTYVGAIGMVYGVAAVLGPVVGGVITNSYLTWRWCFYINLPIAAPPALATLFLVKSSPPTEEQRRPWLQKIRGLDYLGMLLLLPGITSFLLALQFGGALFTWGDKRTIACFVVAGILVIGFVAEQWWMGEKALVPPRLAKMRVVIFGAFFGFCLDSAFFTLVYYVPLWFQAIQGATPEQSGVRYLALCLAFILTIFLSGWGVTKTGYYQPFMLAGTVLVSVGAGLLSTLKVSSGANLWIPFQVIAGLGIGASTQQAAVAVQSSLEEADVAIGVAVVLFFQCFGPTTAITVAQAVFASTLTSGITSNIPGVDAQAIRTSGATQLRDLVSPNQFGTLLQVYNHAITRTFIVAAVMAAASVIGVAGIGLKKIPGEGDEKKDTESK
ncbi:major facilitator superfamily transporter [Colletotrichum scovillei]|uniref:Major facilitator superfamily transporter n=1 Tax=Colletotrichum scovillei TaxID=1209932 RepID=A0A9P7RBR2_9PEZI|nr:major facilitator superfamily transporter [Colletotrichum scovillei]KAF4776913.1 major facilitator superfamily transporter [Colletotrichum scovillei]KAG7053607.1 major facilitator superfamily transporter [Colletotrichum scovillei]KAG7071905.1 major facilitator superfamily transporter [Colletotrichum scovillei]KAG7080183.1 major facilitator superfamily transporter [Colletotrichum scovillei]